MANNETKHPSPSSPELQDSLRGDLNLPGNLRILHECCMQRGYEFEVIDEFSGYLVRVSYQGQHFLSGAGRIPTYPLNGAAASQVAKDKSHTYQLISREGFLIPRTAHIFVTDAHRALRPPGRELAAALAFANENNYPLFVKPNTGSFARDAGVVYNNDDLLYRLVSIGQRDHSAVVQEFITAKEYRLFILDGEIQFAYNKSRPAVRTDGELSVEQLIDRSGLWEFLDRPFLIQNLTFRKWDLTTIPPPGERIEISPVANLAAGGVLEEIFYEFSPKVSAWVHRLANVISLRIFSIDILTSESFNDAEFLVLDVNGSPTLTTLYDQGFQELVITIWSKILDRALLPG